MGVLHRDVYFFDDKIKIVLENQYCNRVQILVKDLKVLDGQKFRFYL